MKFDEFFENFVKDGLSHANIKQNYIMVATFPNHLVTENELIVVFHHARRVPPTPPGRRLKHREDLFVLGC